MKKKKVFICSPGDIIHNAGCGCSLLQGERNFDSSLFAVAEDYLQAVYECAIRAKDATSKARLGQVRRALAFAERVCYGQS